MLPAGDPARQRRERRFANKSNDCVSAGCLQKGRGLVFGSTTKVHSFENALNQFVRAPLPSVEIVHGVA